MKNNKKNIMVILISSTFIITSLLNINFFKPNKNIKPLNYMDIRCFLGQLKLIAASTDPTPTDPTPTDPTPTDPTPVDPTPTDPTPADPMPADPAPTDPTPSAPTPSQGTNPSSSTSPETSSSSRSQKSAGSSKTTSALSKKQSTEPTTTSTDTKTQSETTLDTSKVFKGRIIVHFLCDYRSISEDKILDNQPFDKDIIVNSIEIDGYKCSKEKELIKLTSSEITKEITFNYSKVEKLATRPVNSRKNLGILLLVIIYSLTTLILVLRWQLKRKKKF